MNFGAHFRVSKISSSRLTEEVPFKAFDSAARLTAGAATTDFRGAFELVAGAGRARMGSGTTAPTASAAGVGAGSTFAIGGDAGTAKAADMAPEGVVVADGVAMGEAAVPRCEYANVPTTTKNKRAAA